MAIRMSGLTSGLDTEAIVGALMSAQSLKKTKVSNAKTKLEWKQAKWQDLNTKLCKLYNEKVTKMQLQSSYTTKKASVSDESKAKVTAGSKAANGSYTLEIKNIATAQYLTGDKLTGVTDTATKLKDIDSGLLNKEIAITNGGKTTKFTITADTTIADFTSVLQGAGLNASYDTTQQRFFISSKESGIENSFSITTSGVSGAEVSGRENLKTAVGYSSMTSENKAVIDSAMETLQSLDGMDKNSDEYKKKLDQVLDSVAKAVFDTKTSQTEAAATTYMKAKLYGENYASYETKAKDSLKSVYYKEDGTVNDELVKEYGDKFDLYTQGDKEQLGIESMSKEEYIEWQAQKDYDTAVAKKADSDTTSFVNAEIAKEDIKTQIQAVAFEGKTEDEIRKLNAKGLNKYYGTGNDADPLTVNGFEGTKTFDLASVKTDMTSAVTDYANITNRNYTLTDSALDSLGLCDITLDADGAAQISGTKSSGLALVSASDSKILLNKAELTSKSSTVSANGLTIDLTGLTKEDEPITFSVSNDVDAVYNSIKSFIKEYNEIMKEMNTLYSADSAKGYEPLSSEEKKAMTDEDVKLWEDKIKNSLLRNDTTLGSIKQGMRNAMMSQVEYDGKKYSLASFGIMTSTDYTEGGLYHIYGDEEDSIYADRDDKLRKALEEDPDLVVNVLSKVFGNLRSTMSEKMAGSKVSSALTFYNDIKMKDDIKQYEEEIEEWEDRLASMEDSYYSKFTAMEKALAKLQSQQSSLSGLFGG